MTLTNYSHLKQQIILSAGQSDKHSQILGVLKEYYKDEIDSPRRYENINTIGELMRVLEIRDILSEDNVMPLKEVASRLSNNRELLRKIDIYESTHVQRGFINQYGKLMLLLNQFLLDYLYMFYMLGPSSSTMLFIVLRSYCINFLKLKTHDLLQFQWLTNNIIIVHPKTRPLRQ